VVRIVQSMAQLNRQVKIPVVAEVLRGAKTKACSGFTESVAQSLVYRCWIADQISL
jgi:hypothetical protein